MVNPVIEQKFDIIFKNFYNDLYDIIEDNKLDNDEALGLLIASFSTVTIQTFKKDTPKVLKIMKQHYDNIERDPETKEMLEDE